jgi:hypothetical protein
MNRTVECGIFCINVDCFYIPKDGDVKNVINLRILQNAGNIFTS